MAGYIYLWMLWSIWTISTFILNKNNSLRLPIACSALLLVIVFPFSISFFTLQIQLTALILTLFCYIYIAKQSRLQKIYSFMSIFIVMTGYTGFLLVEMVDPAWILIDRRVLLTILLIILAFCLYPNSYLSLITCIIIGTFHGEILFSTILLKWNITYIVGTGGYLDLISYCIIIVFFIRFIYKLVAYVITSKQSLVKSNRRIV